ncbi:hypothetical protein L873DRAFT_1842563 [Choiromyces venosus 120613-1]|uniref:Spo7-domain-containing protein n=1 Tax=Choiromyces venosus 120613-1 TaxID=1336337 RepID=A0A3N4JWJ3_9PEZI|nr:hypothetical protein L873DRAFT_1842563 [Choiromyces venosus 120613-1]
MLKPVYRIGCKTRTGLYGTVLDGVSKPVFVLFHCVPIQIVRITREHTPLPKKNKQKNKNKEIRCKEHSSANLPISNLTIVGCRSAEPQPGVFFPFSGSLISDALSLLLIQFHAVPRESVTPQPGPEHRPPSPMTSRGTDNPEFDLAVKGSLPSTSSSSPLSPSTSSPLSTLSSTAHPRPPLPPGNPLDSAPCSPPQVYLNLLILEASLRSQYLHHLARRRKSTFFLLLLFLWVGFFFYRLFFLGGSPYYYLSLLEWLSFGGGVVTACLYYAIGLYHKSIVEPRRFFSMANRGLRGFNVKLVKIPLSYKEWVLWWWDWYTFSPPPASAHLPPARRTSTAKRRTSSVHTRRPTPPIHTHGHTTSISATVVGGKSSSLLTPHPEEAMEDGDDDEVEEYLPGGLHLKIVILPKRFTPDFREGWEIYRAEYWERENEIRANHRKELYRWRKNKSKLGTPPPQPPQLDPAMTSTRVRGGSTSRPPSVSSRAGTPEPDSAAAPAATRQRKGSLVAKRRPNLAPGLRSASAASGEISDSGSTTSALEETRRRRSESPVTDRSSSSTAGSAKKKASGRGRGRGKKNC